MVKVNSIVKKYDTILGLDCSTRSLAYSKWHKGKFVTCGEVFSPGSSTQKRLGFIHSVIPPLVDSGVLRADVVVLEGAVMVNNNTTTLISLSYMFGAIMGAFSTKDMPVALVKPITWQAFIGNPNLKAEEKAAIQKQFPGMSKSWYLNKGREVRKQKTLDWARQYASIDSGSDNVSDAIGVGYYGVKNQTMLVFE